MDPEDMMAMDPEGFMYVGDCPACGDPMDQNEAYECQNCGTWLCRNCWTHDGTDLCADCGYDEETEDEL